MNKKGQIIIIEIALIMLLVFAAILLVWIISSSYLDSRDYIRQCQELGYDTFKSYGWTGDFCVGDKGAVQVIINNGKLSVVIK